MSTYTYYYRELPEHGNSIVSSNNNGVYVRMLTGGGTPQDNSPSSDIRDAFRHAFSPTLIAVAQLIDRRYTIMTPQETRVCERKNLNEYVLQHFNDMWKVSSGEPLINWAWCWPITYSLAQWFETEAKHLSADRETAHRLMAEASKPFLPI